MESVCEEKNRTVQHTRVSSHGEENILHCWHFRQIYIPCNEVWVMCIVAIDSYFIITKVCHRVSLENFVARINRICVWYMYGAAWYFHLLPHIYYPHFVQVFAPSCSIVQISYYIDSKINHIIRCKMNFSRMLFKQSTAVFYYALQTLCACSFFISITFISVRLLH